MNRHHHRSSWKCSVAAAVALAAAGWGAVAPVLAADGTWNADEDGNWDDPTKWANGVVADGAGFTARFDVDLTATRTVTVTPSPASPGTRTIGNLFFRDAVTTGSAFDWILGMDAAAPATTLTLDVPSGLAQVNVNNRNATIDPVLAGNDGLAKVGAGNLLLTAANTLTGPVQVFGGDLTLQGANGSLLGATGFTVDRATFELHNNAPANTAPNPNRVGDATPIRLNSGTLSIFGPNATGGAEGVDETVGPVTVRGGAQIRLQPAGTVPTFLRLGGTAPNGLIRVSDTDVVRFNRAGGGAFGGAARVIINGQDASSFLGGWATATRIPAAGGGNYSSDFAAYDTTDAGGAPMGIVPLASAGRPADLNDASLTDTSDVRITSTEPPPMAANRTVRSLVLASPSAGPAGTTTTFTQDLGGNTLNLASGGLLRGTRNLNNANAATDVFVISNGTVTAGGAAAGGNLFATVEEAGAGTTNVLQIDAAIANSPGRGPVTLVKSGPGQLVLRGNNTHAGGTVLNDGPLFAHYGPGVNPLGTGPITLVAGTLQLRSDAPVTNVGGNVTTDSFNPRVFGGRSTPATAGGVAFNFGTLTVNNSAGLPSVELDLETVANTFDPASPTDAASFNFGATTINADTVLTANRTGAAPNFRTTAVTLAGVTDGAGAFSLTKNGNGSLEITGPGTYDGGTVLNGGRLTVSGTGSLGTGPVTVNGGSLLANTAAGAGLVNVNGGTFGGTGSITGSLAMNDGTLAPGDGPGTLGVGGNLTQSPISTFLVELAGKTPGDGPTFHDQLSVTGTGDLNGVINVVVDPVLLGSLDPADRFLVLTRSGGAGAFTNAPEGELVTFPSGVIGRVTYRGGNGDDVEVFNVVPEPGTAGLLGLAGVGLLARRRRTTRVS